VSYEAATWDFRGATYSSVRMASALEWLTVLRRRENLIVPFCRAVYEAWLDEQVQRGLVDFPGGYAAYQMKRALTVRSTWTGPAKPQADDFKTARAYEVRKGMQATTLAEIAEEYGRDWDDDARQRAKENAFHDKLGLPRPWAPQDMIETPEGQELALKDPGNDSSGEKIDPKRKGTKKSGGGEKRQRGGGRNPAEREPADASLEAELHEGE
jgi:capsid protein